MPGPNLTGDTYTDPSADILMHLVDLWTVGKTTIPGHVDELADALSAIIDALDAVELNWAGDSQKAAQDVNTRWKAAVTSLFGTKKNPGQGVVSRIAGGIQGAALNLSTTESSVVDLWQSYISKLEDMLAGRPPGDTPGGGDGEQSVPISEV
ncbi:WXG100 family type VII secretion target [Actinoplanes sp. NPDC000266]